MADEDLSLTGLPQRIVGSNLPVSPGYVTSLAGDPNAPPVAYRNPNAPAAQAAPQPDPLANAPAWVRRWLENDAARRMIERSIQLENSQRR